MQSTNTSQRATIIKVCFQNCIVFYATFITKQTYKYESYSMMCVKWKLLDLQWWNY